MGKMKLNMAQRLFLAGLILAAFTCEAFSAERTAPNIGGIGGEWVGQVRFEVQGSDDGTDPYLHVFLMSMAGRPGVPLSQSGGTGCNTSIGLSPAEARALAEALNEWAEDPTSNTVYLKVRN